MENKNIRIINPTRDIYDRMLFGSQRVLPFTTSLTLNYAIRSSEVVSLRIRYLVVARFTGEEATIEDIYSWGTDRYMALACLDGPVFPFYTSETK